MRHASIRRLATLLKRSAPRNSYPIGSWAAWYRDFVSVGEGKSAEHAGPSKDATEREWPDDVPNRCPPVAATPTSGRVYRRDCCSADWQNAIQNRRFAGRPDCERASLSCCVDLEDLRQRMAMRTEWAACGIVVATLEPKHGVILQTGTDRGHYSLWLRRDALLRIRELFKAV